MSLISFIKEAGEKILDALLPDKANADELLKSISPKSVWATLMCRPGSTAARSSSKAKSPARKSGKRSF